MWETLNEELRRMLETAWQEAQAEEEDPDYRKSFEQWLEDVRGERRHSLHEKARQYLEPRGV